MITKKNPEARPMYTIIGFDEPCPSGEFEYHFASFGELYRFCQRKYLALCTFFITGVKSSQVEGRLKYMLEEPQRDENPFATLQRLKDTVGVKS